MAFYSSKCEMCAERSKRIVKRIKCHDDKGKYYISFFECNNYGCHLASKASKVKSQYTSANNKKIIKNTTKGE